jgi:hypothetical protein
MRPRAVTRAKCPQILGALILRQEFLALTRLTRPSGFSPSERTVC